MKLNGLIFLGLALLTLGGCPARGPETGASAWEDYRERSRQWQRLDRLFIQKELESLGLETPQPANYAQKLGFDPEKSIPWFDTEAGRALAKSLVSFQTPSGGWSKRTRMGDVPRRAGQAFGVESNYIPTFDNDATTTQLRALAKAHTATGKTLYAEAFYKGLHLIFEAQYPNGGWPQTYPLVGGYHDHITFNDHVMVNIVRLLHDIARGEKAYTFVPEPLRQTASQRLDRAISLILETQVKSDDKLSLWAGQYEARSLKPAPARAYEMVSLATAESVQLLGFLMELDTPSPATVAAIHAGIDWFTTHKIEGHRWPAGAAELQPDPEAPPLWPRFAEIGSHRPLFGDRDGSIHYDLSRVSSERRKGYAWFIHSPNKLLKNYTSWQDARPNGTNP